MYRQFFTLFALLLALPATYAVPLLERSNGHEESAVASGANIVQRDELAAGQHMKRYVAVKARDSCQDGDSACDGDGLARSSGVATSSITQGGAKHRRQTNSTASAASSTAGSSVSASVPFASSDSGTPVRRCTASLSPVSSSQPTLTTSALASSGAVTTNASVTTEASASVTTSAAVTTSASVTASASVTTSAAATTSAPVTTSAAAGGY